MCVSVCKILRKQKSIQNILMERTKTHARTSKNEMKMKISLIVLKCIYAGVILNEELDLNRCECLNMMAGTKQYTV